MPLTREEYGVLEGNSDFWTLVKSGVVSLERTARHDYAIKASSHVGRARIDGTALVIEEKVKGALTALLQIEAPLDARILEVAGFVERSERVLEQLGERFIRELHGYLLNGRRKVYVAERKIGGLPKGKLNVAGTMRVWAKGRVDQMAFTSDELSADLPENRLIGLSLANLDHALPPNHNGSVLREQIRTLAVLFDDVDWPQLSRQPLERLSELFDAKLQDPKLEGLRKLLGLARIFALHFGPGAAAQERIPVSWFVNLETLFEDAFIVVLREAGSHILPDFSFREGRTLEKTVITSPPSYRARPDLVGCIGDKFPLIMDTKYKDLEENPDQGDLYQLVVHMSAFAAPLGVLVYPAESYGLRFLGSVEGGGKIYVALCGLATLRNDVRNMLQDLNSRESLVATPIRTVF